MADRLTSLMSRHPSMQVQTTEKKGKGVFTTCPFKRGEYICEYASDLVAFETAREREARYRKNSKIGSYMESWFLQMLILLTTLRIQLLQKP